MVLNVRGIANAAVQVLNPDLIVTLKQSTGYTIGPDGSQQPVYAPDIQIAAQLQSASGGDLRQTENLNLQGDKLTAYLDGDWRGVIRVAQTGGDIIVVPTGPYQGTWLVQVVMETWPTWSKLMLTLQNGS